MIEKNISYCGFAVIVGRPNIGKSTLINQLIGKKISITSRKPQTTRYKIRGIYTDKSHQIIYIDTPGVDSKETREINRLMNRIAINSIYDVDVIIFMVETLYWTYDDEIILNKLRDIHRPIVLVINKIDIILDKNQLLPHIKFLSNKINFENIIPICAENGLNVRHLNNIVKKFLPKAKHCFPINSITDRSHKFMASEIIREQLIRFLGQELPYSSTVEIEQFIYKRDIYNIYALVLVEHNSQKKIVIGKQANRIKKIGIKARSEMESFFSKSVYLELWVKVKIRWYDDEKIIHRYLED